MIPAPRPRFVHGCNYPWSTDGTVVYYGLDFGENVWGSHLGVTSRLPAIARDLEGMAALGFTTVRWFVFCDGRAGIVFDDRGYPTGLDDHFFPDLDAALSLAAGVGLQLCLVLLDHHWMFRGVRQVIADPVSGDLLEAALPSGRARVLRDAAGREALFSAVLEPVVSRYGPGGARSDLGPAIFAWELMNEPDFVVEEWEQDLSSHVAEPIRFADLAELVARFNGMVHLRSNALTTIGCARLRNLWSWENPGLGIDLLQIHSYPNLNKPAQDIDIFGQRPDEFGVFRPLLLGEFPGDPLNQHPLGVRPPEWSLEDYLEWGLAAGLAGAWPWSFSGTDRYGRPELDQLRAFASRHPSVVNARFGRGL